MRVSNWALALASSSWRPSGAKDGFGVLHDIAEIADLFTTIEQVCPVLYCTSVKYSYAYNLIHLVISGKQIWRLRLRM